MPARSCQLRHRLWSWIMGTEVFQRHSRQLVEFKLLFVSAQPGSSKMQPRPSARYNQAMPSARCNQGRALAQLRLCLSKAHVRATRECLLQPRIRSSGITRFIEVGSAFSAILSTSMYTKTTKCIWLVRVGLFCQQFQHGTSCEVCAEEKEFRMHVIRKRKKVKKNIF